MPSKNDILINQYGQGLIGSEPFIAAMSQMEEAQKKLFWDELLFLILQSKPEATDIAPAIEASGLKPTFTPCVLLQKGVKPHHLRKIIELPEAESDKALLLLLSLFKIAYQRRYLLEKNDPNKWWYWDLSDSANLEKL
ncbi:MAG: hypothetical protein J0L99_16810 [Chitinophagales bacterium]|nr:hypothetical protein [Chitinophagales bacterium]